jgi:hypothetical protein
MSFSLKQLLEEKKMSLIVSLPENKLEHAQAAILAGADAVKMHVNVNHRASGNSFTSTDSYKEEFLRIRDQFSGPLGIVPGGSFKDITQSELEELIALGFNYYSIYAHDMPAWMLNLKEIEKTFAINDTYSIGNIGKVKHLGITAIETSIIPGEEYGSPLTFRDVLAYNNFTQKVDVPVLVPSQRHLLPGDMYSLYQSGVKGVMLGAVVIGNNEESIKSEVLKFREKIDSL